MQEYYNIKEVAKLLQIPTSTLRYWDEEEIIHTERDSFNNYRKFSLEAVMELSSVSFYRSLGIPVKEVKQMMESEVKVQQNILEEEGEKIERQIQKMYEQRQRIFRQKMLLEEAERLKTLNFRIGIPTIQSAVSFERENKKHWECITNNPDKFVLILDIHEVGNVFYGVCADETNADETTLWKWDETADYVECMLKARNNDDRKNNLEECLAMVKKSGRRPKEAAAQYLTSEWKGELIDYYRMWIRLEC